MTVSDLRQIRRIERDAYGESWPQTTFEQELENGFADYFVAIKLRDDSRFSANGQPNRSITGTVSFLRQLIKLPKARDDVLGFAGLWYSVDQLNLVTIAVASKYQHQGIGRLMLLHCFALAKKSGLRSIALEVRASNERAIRLYESFGFRRVGRRARYYANNNEDAIIMLTPQMDELRFREHVHRLHAENTALTANYSSTYPEDLFSASAQCNEE